MSITTGNDQEFRRMIWSCRRGQLELDVWLTPLQHAWQDFTQAQRFAVMKLLEESDDVLWDYFLQRLSVLDVMDRYIDNILK